MSDLTSRIEAERRQLLSMKQHQVALASGDLTEADIERMAIRRVESGKTSGRRPQRDREPSGTEPRLDFLGVYVCDEDEPLLPDPWWVAWAPVPNVAWMTLLSLPGSTRSTSCVMAVRATSPSTSTGHPRMAEPLRRPRRRSELKIEE